ncbi:radical SAM protein [Sedimenticola selenatireducens]|uniref:radical SAM protein n=1 Tax=Sedimenticola selenatireducens TaxID=191960 RepID=UPI002AAB612B|nr:radical SAM protein [Sedimenticola selenatireducens]
MISYDMPLYRPPSEGNNLIIQATLGCHFNQCSFCSMYKQKRFTIRPLETVFAEITEAARAWPDAQRVFLADGDALTLPTDHLLAILEKLAEAFPRLSRVSCYANPSDILRKRETELARLREHKLNLLYVGIESGSGTILKKITKGASPRSIQAALEKAHNCRLKVSATVILGLGGKSRSEEHIQGTIELLSRAPVTYLSTLQLFLETGERQHFLDKFGEPFSPQDDQAILREQRRLVAGIEPPNPIIFRSNHASNALALAGNLPRDRERLLARIDQALTYGEQLRPRQLRGL